MRFALRLSAAAARRSLREMCDFGRTGRQKSQSESFAPCAAQSLRRFIHHTPVLLAVDLRLEHADVRHIAVLLGVIQPAALPTAQARREPFDLILNGTE